MYAIGIDIGTTSVCGVLVDNNGNIVKSITLDNDACISFPDANMGFPLRFGRVQNPRILGEMSLSIYNDLRALTTEECSVGVTGQMHGICYMDKDGVAVSPLYTWQDGRGSEPYRNGTYTSTLSEITGYTVATGYGSVSNYYNTINDLIPESAHKIATIQDYVVCVLTGNKEPVLHPSNGASLGLFDLKSRTFDKVAIERAGMNYNLYPTVVGDEVVGKTSFGDSVTVALGDNQASVYGSLTQDDALIVNIGTGAQISAVSDFTLPAPGLELRPYVGDKYLLVGCSLCGGYSYGLLKQFFSLTAESLGVERAGDDIYTAMGKMAESVYNDSNPLTVSTLFKGSRVDPTLRGSVTGISDTNFTPAHLTLGVLRGIHEELYNLYTSMPKSVQDNIHDIIGSGNGIKRNPTLRKIISEGYGKSLKMPAIQEDASFGTAIFSLKITSGVDLKSTIKYTY